MDSTYLVIGSSASHPSVEAWSVERLPFEPKGWMVQFRDAVRKALLSLKSIAGSELVAQYISPITQRCDVENIIFYNVGARWFAHLQCNGILFERVLSKPPDSPGIPNRDWEHYLSYTLFNRQGAWIHWKPSRLLARWDHIPCETLTSSSKATQLWYKFKLSAGDRRVHQVNKSTSQHTSLGMSVTINAPKGAGINLTSVIKPLFDGIISVFNTHDGTDRYEVTRRIAAELGIGQKEVIHLLEDEQVTVLGQRRLVWPWRKSIQWNPSDDRLVVGQLSVTEFASLKEWGLSGELFEVSKVQ